MITAAQLKAIAPRCLDVTVWSSALSKACEQFDINTRVRLAAFIAQVAYESVQFTRMRENMSYNAKALRQIWPARFPTDEWANAYARQPERLANYVYANRMGNGPPSSGDGWKYRGGGLIQLTGKANYAAAGEALGIGLVETPSMTERAPVSALVSAWFWVGRGCNELADTGDFERITETINGPAKLGHEARVELWETAKQVLGC